MTGAWGLVPAARSRVSRGRSTSAVEGEVEGKESSDNITPLPTHPGAVTKALNNVSVASAKHFSRRHFSSGVTCKCIVAHPLTNPRGC